MGTPRPAAPRRPARARAPAGLAHEVLADVLQGDDEEHDEGLPGVHRGGERVHPLPAAVGDPAGDGRRRGGRHSPASRASPREASRSRRRAASCGAARG